MGRAAADPVAHFDANVDKTPGCWLWTGPLSLGYGTMRVDGKSTSAHRFSYERHVGAIPDGLQLDHLCRVKRCVKPGHLEPVTGMENIRRAQLGRYLDGETCRNGHPLGSGVVTLMEGRAICGRCFTEGSQSSPERKVLVGMPADMLEKFQDLAPRTGRTTPGLIRWIAWQFCLAYEQGKTIDPRELTGEVRAPVLVEKGANLYERRAA